MKDFGFVLGELLRFHETATERQFRFWDRELGIWLTLARANIQEEAMAQGIPVLRGPYVVDFSDIPHDGDTMTLYTPVAGEIVLGLFSDLDHLTELDSGGLDIGTAVEPQEIAGAEVFSDLGSAAIHPVFFDGTETVLVRMHNPSGPDATQGHGELYVLAVRAIAP